MAKLHRVKLRDILCLQASVGVQELSGAGPSVYHDATQEEILAMTKRRPLGVYWADLGYARRPFLNDGTHRSYVIRHLSANPCLDTEVYVKDSLKPPTDVDTMQRIARQRRSVEKLEIRV